MANSFFDDFFGSDEKPTEKCADCGSTENLSILYTDDEGYLHWICPRCKARREAKRDARARKAAFGIGMMMDMD